MFTTKDKFSLFHIKKDKLKKAQVYSTVHNPQKMQIIRFNSTIIAFDKVSDGLELFKFQNKEGKDVKTTLPKSSPKSKANLSKTKSESSFNESSKMKNPANGEMEISLNQTDFLSSSIMNLVADARQGNPDINLELSQNQKMSSNFKKKEKKPTVFKEDVFEQISVKNDELKESFFKEIETIENNFSVTESQNDSKSKKAINFERKYQKKKEKVQHYKDLYTQQLNTTNKNQKRYEKKMEMLVNERIFTAKRDLRELKQILKGVKKQKDPNEIVTLLKEIMKKKASDIDGTFDVKKNLKKTRREKQEIRKLRRENAEMKKFIKNRNELLAKNRELQADLLQKTMDSQKQLMEKAVRQIDKFWDKGSKPGKIVDKTLFKLNETEGEELSSTSYTSSDSSDSY